MSVPERLRHVAERFLDGDESVPAAQALEGVLIEEYLGDERIEDLLTLFRCTHQDLAGHTPTPRRSVG
jgi:hypothetical protein